ncbi:aminoglycoside phosphotransferase [Marinicauda salina]|uniref:Aminoglycoside phosphotransferase n=1 Tax=Marinicauda salina TaxID=2135793 RepID=A0A2U2BWS0_9PROT|nr:phosphotransferase [Marinicauda salina]PWE18466.1 aminoglycoside phosphotransferase [Marinicauda salina]
MASSPDPDRAAARSAFIAEAGWGEAEIEPFPGDASTRGYFRLRDGEKTAIVMDAPGGAEAPACPPKADQAERRELGYNAMARLAGPNPAAFAGLAAALTERGFSAPRVPAADLEQGFLLLEDLGDDLFARLIPDRAHEGALYAAAVDALAAIHRASFEAEVSAFGEPWRVMDYDPLAMTAEAELFLDWYAAKRAGAEVTDQVRADFAGLWAEAAPLLDAHRPGLVLRDYHAENLIWLPDRAAEARVGLLDFQDALFGHPAYDLVSLIEDARRDVSPDLAEPLKARFFERAGLADRDAFDAAYALLGAQRNAKILGIFVRLAERDGKPRYLDLLPRVARHFAGDLAHPALADLRAWVDRHAGFAFEEAGR